MFAVMKTGGKQYRVARDDVLTVEKLAADVGETVQFNEVLMLGGGDFAVDRPSETRRSAVRPSRPRWSSRSAGRRC